MHIKTGSYQLSATASAEWRSKKIKQFWKQNLYNRKKKIQINFVEKYVRKCNKNCKNAHFYGQQRNERCNHTDEEKKTEEGDGNRHIYHQQREC